MLQLLLQLFYCLLPIKGKPGARGLPGPRGIPGLEVRLSDATHIRMTPLSLTGIQRFMAQGFFYLFFAKKHLMSLNISHAKINIICFQGDEGPIGPPGLTGLEVSYWLNTCSYENRGYERKIVRSHVGHKTRLITFHQSIVS